MEETRSEVYIKIDPANRILRCEGGYTMSNISNVDEWILIDEGTGDKYNLCQSHYFEGGLYTDDGVCRYVWEQDACRLRTEEEMEADRTVTVTAPSIESRVGSLEIASAETQEALEMILSGVTE